MDIDIVSIIAPKIQSWQITAANFAKSRFLVAASEYGMNDKESAELMKIADGIQIEIFTEGSSVGMNINYGQSPYLDVIQNGLPTPVTHGGENITNPDGSISPSNAVTNGVPLPDFAKPGEDVMGEVAVMLKGLFRNEIESCVSESNSEIADALKTYLIPNYFSLLGGS